MFVRDAPLKAGTVLVSEEMADMTVFLMFCKRSCDDRLAVVGTSALIFLR